ncbi:hypothetical protein [Halobacterium salinarum]|uniref:hypothetical protein n=1 Tax=Halobacterium salinarum TaxID=2242 RepID=UPI0025577A9F|nr:hypothetical protein [Halobacterium salinarum]MDL0133540.1 hypothetical protein [Halobacterium salinarum]
MTERETLRGPPHTCPMCGSEYDRLGRHWGSTCEPALSDHQRSVLAGLALSGCTVDDGSIIVQTTTRPLIEWTADQLGWLAGTLTRVNDDNSNRDPIYRLTTPTHWGVEQYEGWSSSGPPADYELDATAARVWWAYAGGLQWQGVYDSQRTATFSALDDDRADWIQRVLETAGVDATRVGKRVQWHGEQVREWFGGIGERVPGAAHKWAERRLAYQAWADVSRGASRPPQSESKGRYTDEDCAHYLVQAVVDIGEPISQTEYAEWARGTGAPSMDTVRDRLGSGSWPDTCSAVGVTAAGTFDISYDDFLDILVEIHDAHGTWPKTTEYDDLRPSDSPSLAQVYEYQEHEGWGDAIERAKQRAD